MKNRQSAFRLFVIFNAVLILALIISLLIRQNNDLSENFTQQRLKDQSQISARIAEGIELSVFEAFTKLSLIAENNIIKTGSTEECSQKLIEIFPTFNSNFLDTISRMNSEGIFDCSTTPTTPGFDGKVLPHLVKILEDPEHKPVIGKIAVSSAADSRAFTSLHVPIFLEGEFNGTIGTALFFEELGEEFISQELSDDNGITVQIVDQDLKILYTDNTEDIGNLLVVDPTQPLKKRYLEEFKNGTLDAKGGGVGRVKLVTYEKILLNSTEWLVLVETDKDLVATSSGNGTQIGNLNYIYALLALLIVFGFSFGVLRYVSQYILNPIKHIEHTVQDVSEGDLDARVDPKKAGSSNEFSSLANSINSMIIAISESQKDLEYKVKERTEKLNKANEQLKDKVTEVERFNSLMVGRELQMAKLKEQIKELEKNKK